MLKNGDELMHAALWQPHSWSSRSSGICCCCCCCCC